MQDATYQAVIFDVDGLIVDTEAIYCRTFNETLGPYGISLTPEDYTACVGRPTEHNCQYAVSEYCLDTTPEALNRAWMERFDGAISDPEQVVLMPGILELLDDLRRKAYRLGLASSTHRPRMEKTLRNGLLSRLDGVSSLAEIFSATLSGSDVQHTKPAPDIFLLTAERLGVKPDRCVVFEDSEAGVLAGKAAGMTVFAVPNFFTRHQDHSAADVVLSSLSDAITQGHL